MHRKGRTLPILTSTAQGGVARLRAAKGRTSIQVCIAANCFPLKSPPLAISPPKGGDRHFTVLLGNIYFGGLCSPSVTHTLSHCFPITSNQCCVYSVIFSLRRRCTGCCVPFSDPRSFLPLTVYGTTHAHLVHMCWPLLWGIHQMGHNFAACGTYALVWSLKWIMRVLNSQGSRLWWLHHPSRFTCVLFACISGGSLKYPCNPPPGGETVIWRPSPPPPPGGRRSHATGDFKGGEGSTPAPHPWPKVCSPSAQV